MMNSHQYQNQLVQDRFGSRVSARLSASTDGLSHDVSERLRAARVRAVSCQKLVLVHGSVTQSGGGAAAMTFGQEHLSWWNRVAAVAPLLALVIGLIAIDVVQSDNWVNELAEIDSALLTDDLPPAAYTDPGFMQFIRINAGKN